MTDAPREPRSSARIPADRFRRADVRCHRLLELYTSQWRGQIDARLPVGVIQFHGDDKFRLPERALVSERRPAAIGQKVAARRAVATLPDPVREGQGEQLSR